jgi:hypothetical protein
LGSVAFIKNLAGEQGSLREVAGRLLTSALNEDPPDPCAPNCPDAAKSEIVYRVAPVAFLAQERQNDICRRFETETSARPLEFGKRNFANVSDMNDWFMEFSQGRGSDGRTLYEKCSSNCSPRYTFLIAEQNTGYAVKTEVLCGLARDRSNDQYRVSTALRRSCAVN